MDPNTVHFDMRHGCWYISGPGESCFAIPYRIGRALSKMNGWWGPLWNEIDAKFGLLWEAQWQRG